MKFSAFTLSLLFAGASAAHHESKMSDIRSKRRLSADFMHAMREPAIAAARQKGRSEKIRKLHEDLLKASRHLADNSQYSQYQQNAYNGGQWYSNVNGNSQYAQQEGQYANMYSDMSGYVDAPFDMTSRAFKYSGCAAIKSYDDSRAYETGNPMVIDTYAVFRLCPADKCNDYSMTGCGKNYGEYAVEMKTYLAYVLGYYEDRYDEYCDYCEPCDWEYQAEAKSNLNTCYANQAKKDYQQVSQSSQQAYQDYYNAQQYGQNANGQNNNGYNNGQGQNNYNKYYSAASSNSANYASSSSSSGNGNRDLANYGNWYGNGNNNNNQNNQNQNNNNNGAANAAMYGYYDENGDWVDAEGGADGAGGYWGQDGNYYPYNNNNNNNYQYGGGTSVCKDGSTCDYCTAQNEETFDYCDDYICGDYYTYCSDLYGELQDFDATEYLECQAYTNDYGQTYYIGPHCGSDHYTVSLGVFSDENCLNYIGEQVSLSTVLGFKFSDTDIFKLPKECISCDGAEEYEEQQQQNEGRYGEYVTSPATTEAGVVAMCSALYTVSAQCNMNMNNFESISKYMSQYELDQESRYCAFIENIIYGAYDESGEIVLQADQFDFTDWKNPKQYKKLRMSLGQALGLSASIILCVALAATAAVTNRALTRQSTPWKPKRMTDSALARQNSGIVMGRSRSGPGAAPLI